MRCACTNDNFISKMLVGRMLEGRVIRSVCSLHLIEWEEPITTEQTHNFCTCSKPMAEAMGLTVPKHNPTCSLYA